MCFYVNQRYCNTVVVRENICTPDIELLSISLRPYYLPREFPQLFFTIVYIHPRANVSAAAQMIMDLTHRLDTICPDAPKYILGDFNHCELSKTLRTYEQYVTCATTQNNTKIDLCYGSVRGAYKSLPMPPFGASYHNSVYLMPIVTGLAPTTRHLSGFSWGPPTQDMGGCLLKVCLLEMAGGICRADITGCHDRRSSLPECVC